MVFRDSTHAERFVGINLLAQPEYRRFRALAKLIARNNEPPFVVVKGEQRESQSSWLELLNYINTEGKKGVEIKRYKGLGEMNADQLAETTMNPEKRTLLQVRLEDAVQSEEIFSTLMGEDVESRRKFIEENALDVKKPDILAPSFSALFRNARQRLRRAIRKYATVSRRPCSKPTFGPQPRTDLAFEISGCRCLGSSSGSGPYSIFDFEPVSFWIRCANSRIVISSGLPRLTG